MATTQHQQNQQENENTTNLKLRGGTELEKLTMKIFTEWAAKLQDIHILADAEWVFTEKTTGNEISNNYAK